jgi:hypothetical protein
MMLGYLIFGTPRDVYDAIDCARKEGIRNFTAQFRSSPPKSKVYRIRHLYRFGNHAICAYKKDISYAGIPLLESVKLQDGIEAYVSSVKLLRSEGFEVNTSVTPLDKQHCNTVTYGLIFEAEEIGKRVLEALNI